MPIGTDRPTALQVAPVATIGQEPITPAVSDFMKSFQSGFITVDDIQKRMGEAQVRPSENALKQANNEQGILDATTLAPQRRDLASQKLTSELDNQSIVAELARQKLKQEQLTLANTGAAIPSKSSVVATQQAKEQVAGEQDAAITGTVREQIVAANAPQQRAVIQAYVANIGPVPMELTVMKPGTPKPFDEWVRENHGEDTFPALAAIPAGPNKQGIVDQFFTNLGNDKQIQAEYAAYQKSPQPAVSTKILPENPSFFTELQNQVVKKQEELGLKAAQLKAVPGILEAQAKLPAEELIRIQKLTGELHTEKNNDKDLSLSVLSNRAFNTARALATKPNPTNQDDLGLVYATVKSFDPNAVREGEVKLFQQGIGFPGQAELLYNRITGDKNAVLRPQERASLASLIDTLQESSNQHTIPILQTYFNRAVAGKVPLNQVFNDDELKLLINRGAGTPKPAGTPAASTVGTSAAAGPSQKIQNGFLYQRQPDGTYVGVRKL